MPLLRQLDRLDVVLIVPAYPLGGRGQQAAQESTRWTFAPWAAAQPTNRNARAAVAAAPGHDQEGTS